MRQGAERSVQDYPRGPYDPSLLKHYDSHVTPHVWAGEERPTLKSMNHARKIFDLVQPREDWFREVILGSRLAGLCCSGYGTINLECKGILREMAQENLIFPLSS
ncbi:uncharacterized protein LOC131616351 [Vicia villosa]|uniref:uncharacterized protein LOC131616351 n=1 Tax=Vicia villosa TaxID=3911 RepID=UPI00273CBCC3|nr:uncharacterized protein LOC131616351 [Vicia villosa]